MKILGFDIGITSIGWAYVEGEELKDCGVRIFTKAENPKNGDSLAAPRREARGVRRRLARRKARLNAIKRLLCKEFGLNLSDYLANDGELPKAYQTSKEHKSPYELRTLALSQKLDSKDLARVILHIAKHRGYGNKHAKTGSDKDSGKVLSAIKVNETAMKDKYQSVGEYLYKEFYQKLRLESEKKGNNITKEFKNVRNKKESYEHCVAQEQVRAELELIFAKQKEFGITFSENFESQIIETAFYQKDLKSFENKVGKCVFYDEPRAPKDSLSAIEFVALTRIINTLKNLEEKSKNLGIGEAYGKDKIQEILKIVLDKGEISYKKLREILHLDECILFAKDSKLDYTKGMQEAEKAKLIEFKNLKAFKKAMGEDFGKFSREELDSIAMDIALIKSKENLAKKLQNYSALSKEQVEALSNLNFAKHIDLSFKALDKILPFMREGLRYDEAVKKAGLQEHRKHKQKGEFLIPLKDYEPYLANPVVARALSEYRKVLNALLRKYGNVHKIHLEFTREAGKNYDERKKIEKEQREHFEANQKAIQQCEILGLPINGANILKMKLWIEQKELCVYSDRKITREHLLDSKVLEVDHIYPYSRSFDDSYMNKVLVFAKENQGKGNKTPFEAFGNDKEKWDRILSLSANLPKQKQRRISNKDFKDKELGFIARNINDTGYIARLASQWTNHCLKFENLSENEVSIAGEKGSKNHLEVISGQLTSMLRHYWGLGNKDRNNHLHHAVDAVILAYTNNAMIKAFANFRKNQEENKKKFYAKQIAESEYKAKKAFFEPCKNFRQMVLDKVDSIFVSKPPRKRARGALHKETFYSFEKLCNDKEYSKDNKMDYGGQKGIERALELGKIRQVGTKIVSNGAMVRVDIFKDKKGKFYAVPIYTMDFALGILPNKAVAIGKDKDGVIKDWIEMDSNYTFCFSLFKDDLILVKKKEMEKAELCYFVSFDTSTASIQVEKHNNKFEGLSENEKILYSNATQKEVVGKSIGIQNLKTFEKYQVSPLGEMQKAEFEPCQDIALKSSPKRKN
ncbi:type II CRISPR RNA-guided endonuclease Cas9 [Helicobacter ganmani]|uniref:CRISPR-associated endonuclease Cas9 n=3 Tax=Helicobacter TaxID=209 RepID=A0A3D8IHI0_9HELI|nr:type II CRISPR RNA-guided endonuclease Cas9 [Helicobacter ganmani]RDU64376.1 type II CRISPR RNA-guided endonuclease Cas9 [Helicobacter ganmani]